MLKNRNLIFAILSIILIANSPFLFCQTDANIPIKGICIYIDYPDAPASVTKIQLEGMMNDLDYTETGINRSYRKYWLQQTRRNFDITQDIFFYTAPQPASYYANLQWFEGIELWKNALEWIIANNPDYDWNSLSKWSPSDPFDSEHPNYLAGALKLTTILSSNYDPAGLGATHSPEWNLSNGVFIGKIHGSTLQRPWDATLNLFTVCHESGHAIFGLPDTYDHDGSSGGTAKYTVMSAQGPDVEPVGAPFNYQKKWGYTIEPTIGSNTIKLRADGDSVVIIKNIHDPNEYFALEVRKNSTPGNSLFPVPIGLLIWHVDKKVYSSDDLEDRTRYAHYQYSIVQKDGLFELEKGGPGPPINAGDIYVDGDQFNDDSTPNAHWWAGEASGIEIKDIQLLDDNHLQFTVLIPEIHTEHFDYIPKIDWKLVSATPSLNGYDGTKAFDGDLSTYYHVPYGSNHPRPHELVIDLGDDYDINEFYYTANDNFSPPWEGRIKEYELYFSKDGIDWGNPIASEQFFMTEYTQYQLFSAETARYIKLSALNSYGDDDRTSVAEIDIRGKKTNTTDVHDNKPSLSNNIEISPNPTKNIISVSGLNKDCFIKISNAVGMEIFKKLSLDKSVTIDISNYPAGIYNLTIIDKNQKFITVKKIIKVD